MPITIKARAELEQTIGQSLPLKPWESIEKVVIEADEVKVLMNIADVQETAREVRLKRAGKRLIVWKRTANPLVWRISDDETFWVESTPVVHVKYGQRRTPEQEADQREYEKMCYRPGTASTPLDNYDRVVAGHTTDKMDRYW